MIANIQLELRTHSPTAKKQLKKLAAELVELDQTNTRRGYLHWQMENLEEPINKVW